MIVAAVIVIQIRINLHCLNLIFCKTIIAITIILIIKKFAISYFLIKLLYLV